jgi:hypothetical protein
LPRDGVACARLRRIGLQWGLCRRVLVILFLKRVGPTRSRS